MNKRAYSVKEAMNELGISRTCIGKLIQSGRLKTVRAGRKILIPEWSIKEFLQEK